MTTDVRIKVLSSDYRLRQQVTDEINAKYILTPRESESRYIVRLELMDDDVQRECIIQALSEGSLEYIDTIEVGKVRKVETPAEPNPFVTAYSLLK